MGIIKDIEKKVGDVFDPAVEVPTPEVVPEVATPVEINPIEGPAEAVVETPAEEIVEPVEEVSEKPTLTDAQKAAGQTLEEAAEFPIEGAQIHNQ